MKVGRDLEVVVGSGDHGVQEHLRQCMQDLEGIHVAALSNSVNGVLSIMKSRRPDVLILDVDLPEGGGFDVLRGRNSADRPMVIFTASSQEHALAAFQFHPLDYLLHPVDPVRLADALLQAVDQANGSTHSEPELRLLGQTEMQKQAQKRLMVKAAGKIFFLRPEEIDWVEADRDYVRIHNGSRKYHLRGTISGMEEQLSDERFVRIHRSTIVNVDRIREMQPLSYGEYAVILMDGTRLTLSRSFRERVFSRLVTAA